jgi:hypothetical protein
MESLPFQYQKRDFWEFYCPICKKQRRSFYWPSPRLRHYLRFVGFGLFMAGCLWPWCGFKGLFLILPAWALFEFFYRARARQSLICPYCGFDPYIYKHDVKLARQKVEQFFAARNAAKEATKKSDTAPRDP